MLRDLAGLGLEGSWHETRGKMRALREDPQGKTKTEEVPG